MQPPYIPPQDAAFDAWFANFSTLLTAAPATYGLTAPDAVIVAAGFTTWNAAYLLATNPATRTSPAIADKDSERILNTAMLRPYAVTISRDPAVANGDKTAIGVNLPNTARTPIPAPLTVPGLSLLSAIHFQQTLAYRDTSTPTSKAKPFGAIGVELVQTIAVGAGTDPLAAKTLGTFTKSPLNTTFNSGDVGKLATYWARWVTRSGPGGLAQSGPWSAPLTVAII